MKARLEWVQEKGGEAAEVSSVDNSSASFEKRDKNGKITGREYKVNERCFKDLLCYSRCNY